MCLKQLRAYSDVNETMQNQTFSAHLKNVVQPNLDLFSLWNSSILNRRDIFLDKSQFPVLIIL